MWRGRAAQPPMPQPARPASATNDVNYLSAQVQQVLALVLPESLVTILASISDLLYRLVLGKTNEPPTYASTLLPPVILVLVTYLSFLLVYRSIRSMFSFVIFSLKWTLIIGLIAVLLAYHLGNGDVRQGAQAAAQNTHGLTQQVGNAIRQYPGAQQLAPYLSYVPRQLGMVSGALPALQGMSAWLAGQETQQGTVRGSSRDSVIYEMRNPSPRTGTGGEQNRFRGYRDTRPSRKDSPRRGSNEYARSSFGQAPNEAPRYNWLGQGGTSTPPAVRQGDDERSRRPNAKSQKTPSSSSGRNTGTYDEREALNAGIGDVFDRLSRFFA